MAYSFIATTKKNPNWSNLHTQVFRPDTSIEVFPIESEEPDKYYVGICIPFSKLDKHPNTWDDLVNVIHKMKGEFGFEIFDLYHGFFVTDENINQVKESLFAK